MHLDRLTSKTEVEDYLNGVICNLQRIHDHFDLNSQADCNSAIAAISELKRILRDTKTYCDYDPA